MSTPTFSSYGELWAIYTSVVRPFGCLRYHLVEQTSCGSVTRNESIGFEEPCYLAVTDFMHMIVYRDEVLQKTLYT